MPGIVIAAPVTPSNTPGGYILTFAFPMALFVVTGAVIYLLLFRPHKVPGHHDMAYAGTAAPEATAPDPEAARAAAVAGGLATAAGGGGGEALVEPSGAHLEAAAQLEAEAQQEEAAAQQDAATDPDRAEAEVDQARRLESEAQQQRAQAGQEDDTEDSE